MADLSKAVVYDVGAGIFIGKFVDFFMAQVGEKSMSTNNAPKFILILAVQTIFIGYLTSQYFAWKSRSGNFRTDDTRNALFFLGLFMSSGMYLQRLKSFVKWIEGWGNLEFSNLKLALNNGNNQANNLMMTQKTVDNSVQTQVTDQAMRDRPQNVGTDDF